MSSRKIPSATKLEKFSSKLSAKAALPCVGDSGDNVKLIWIISSGHIFVWSSLDNFQSFSWNGEKLIYRYIILTSCKIDAIQLSFQEELEIKQDSTKEYLGKLQYKVRRDLVLTPYHRRIVSIQSNHVCKSNSRLIPVIFVLLDGMYGHRSNICNCKWRKAIID